MNDKRHINLITAQCPYTKICNNVKCMWKQRDCFGLLTLGVDFDRDNDKVEEIYGKDYIPKWYVTVGTNCLEIICPDFVNDDWKPGTYSTSGPVITKVNKITKIYGRGEQIISENFSTSYELCNISFVKEYRNSPYFCRFLIQDRFFIVSFVKEITIRDILSRFHVIGKIENPYSASVNGYFTIAKSDFDAEEYVKKIYEFF